MHENETMLRACYEAAGQGDLDSFLGALSDDVEFDIRANGPADGVYRGKDGVLSFFQKTTEIYRGTLRVQIIDALANERHGIVLTQESAEYHQRRLEFHSVHNWELREGKLARFTVFVDDSYHRFWSAAKAQTEA